ncbi:uncharacterized protein DUF2568 [Stackebrandtia albiflava]|uniref:Uncharacterized protein DUF2568 n=1 Tax=Stackebrandtia albiflava TaxID=406432 RepID=A0A562VE73_9ACTN|nr:YrdB family protein [Stackebrandtia albiflava]TWJ16189.1 uncharacterized protein DUF2568 [Stackebrandtia albiflava]
MSLHPAMLGVRFLLEMAAFASYVVYGLCGLSGPWSLVVAVGLPIAAAVVWGTFAVPDDPSRSGRAPVPVPGAVRLAVELVVLAGGPVALWAARLPLWGLGFAVVLVAYLLLARDRVAWLLSRR